VSTDGPVFVSYRQSDGTDAAMRVAWALRSAGVPVWQDATDLPPGDTSRRLASALADGLSGAVLVVTPETDRSAVVRHEELPTLLRLERDQGFVLAVVNAVRTPDGQLDYGAPDRLLGQPPGTLSRLLQHPADDPGSAARVARAVLLHRMGRLAWTRGTVGRSLSLVIDVQTRGAPVPAVSRRGDLTLRIRPAASGRMPSTIGLTELAAALPSLPDAVSASGCRAVRVTGGAHLSVALALGCALPASSGTDVTVVDVDGREWSSSNVPGRSGAPLTTVVGHGYGDSLAVGSRREVLAYLDLLPTHSDAAYARLLGDNPGRFAAWRHVRAVSDERLDAADADRLVREVAAGVRELAQSHDNAELHVLVRAPFAATVLLGRLLNTLTVVAYEFEQLEPAAGNDHRPVYVPSLRLTPTAAGGPISSVLLPAELM